MKSRKIEPNKVYSNVEVTSSGRTSVAECLQAYETISKLRKFAERASDGTQSTIKEDVDSSWIIKSDLKGGDPFVGHELDVYNRLMDSGIVPEADMELGVFGSPDSIRIRKINNGGTLYEYAQALQAGLISEPLWYSVCLEVRKTLLRFFELGWIHGDLHAKNIVIELTEQGYWAAYLIDFGVSFNKKTKRSDLADLARIGVFFEKEPNQRDDIEYLEDDLRDVPTDGLDFDWDDEFDDVPEEESQEYDLEDVIRL